MVAATGAAAAISKIPSTAEVVARYVAASEGAPKFCGGVQREGKDKKKQKLNNDDKTNNVVVSCVGVCPLLNRHLLPLLWHFQRWTTNRRSNRQRKRATKSSRSPFGGIRRIPLDIGGALLHHLLRFFENHGTTYILRLPHMRPRSQDRPRRRKTVSGGPVGGQSVT